jgi:hypothetical protein
MGKHFSQPDKKIDGEKNPNFRTGLASNGSRTSLYNTWQAMKQRCSNANHPKYNRYGGRGITVCDEWLNLHGFIYWSLENGWFEGASIDRVDNDKGYFPENCRWVTVSTNSIKKSTTKISIEDAHVIRYRLLLGESCASIAKDYPICDSGISAIKRGITHVPFAWILPLILSMGSLVGVA